MSLAKYKQMRHFNRTPEPAGGKRGMGKDLVFVVQKHFARRLHYDFRLELDGVLKSWAVPKGPNPDPSQKSLAVHVEDHPYDYKDFEGEIPQGQYGAGTVEIWDNGTWTPIGDPRKGLRDGKLSFELHGKKLNGEWRLIQIRSAKYGDKDNWLLMKVKDDSAQANGASANGSATKTKASTSRIKPERTLPEVDPQLATWVPEAPQGKQWLHEVKYDGYRLIGYVNAGQARLMTRGKKDWSHRFPKIAAELSRLPAKNAIVDGEVVVLDEKGRSHFQNLQGAWKGQDVDPILYLFDLMYVEDEDLRNLPLVERKQRLAVLLRHGKKMPRIRYSEHVEGKGDEVVTAACKMALEGIISKRADAAYSSGRSTTWLKCKCGHRQEFVIIGYTDPKGARSDFGALLLGYHDSSGKLIYAGRTGTGFDSKLLKEIKKKLDAHERPTPATHEPPPARERRAAHWVSPVLVAEVEFAGWTSDGSLRQAAFLGLRPDKPASEVVREDLPPRRRENRPLRVDISEPSTRAAAISSKAHAEHSAEVKLTSPEKVIFPDVKVTKSDLAEYYDRVAERMLPYVLDRPLTLYRCPSGIGKKCFMQRHHADGLPEPIVRIDIQGSKEIEPYLMIRERSGLRALVQINATEIHGWGSTARDVEKPDQLVFDLDPDPDFSFKRLILAAQDLRKLLTTLKMNPFIKTTGGKGLHVVVPIEPTVEWPQIKEFCKLIAEDFARGDPKSYTTNMRKAVRGGRLFLDYLRNDRSATAILPYSVRAREGAPVSVPIAWNELSKLKAPNQFTVQNLPARLKRLRRDPWEAFNDRRVDLQKVIPNT